MNTSTSIYNDYEAQLVTRSRAILTRNCIASLVLGLMGAIGIAENALIVGVVLRGRLATKAHHYICMLNLAVVDTLTGVVSACVGLKRFILYASGGNEVSPTWRCIVDIYAISVCQALCLWCTLMIAIDRLFGAAAPTTYQGVDERRMRIFLYITGALTFAVATAMAFGNVVWPGQLMPACLVALVNKVDWLDSLTTWSIIVIEALVVLTYVAILSVLLVRYWKQASTGHSPDVTTRAAKSATFIVGVFVITFVNADCILMVLGYADVDGVVLPYFGPWYLCMQYLACCLNLPIYVWRNEQFREQLKKMVVKKSSKTKVKPVAIGMASQK